MTPNFRPKRISPPATSRQGMGMEAGQWRRFAYQPADRRPAAPSKELPVGKHPLQLYSLATPNGVKVTIMLEELLAAGHNGAEYDAWLINIGEGDQFGSRLRRRSTRTPRSRRMMDHAPTRRRCGCSNPARSCSISPRSSAPSCPPTARARAEALNWLIWQMGSAPVPRRRLRPFLRLCADEDRIRRSTASPWR